MFQTSGKVPEKGGVWRAAHATHPLFRDNLFHGLAVTFPVCSARFAALCEPTARRARGKRAEARTTNKLFMGSCLVCKYFVRALLVINGPKSIVHWVSQNSRFSWSDYSG